jgi:hypothetical protein
MRKLSLALAVICGAGFFGTAANALPAVGAGLIGAPRQNNLIEDVRLYCHRGPVFLHWGPCAHDAWRFGYYYRPRPRYYYRPYAYYRPHYYRRYYHRPRWHYY